MNRRSALRVLGCTSLAPLLSIPTVVRSFATEPYYGFFPSALGAEYKQFRHNLLGFSIDIPARWTFGVMGQGPLTVALIYPEGLDTSRFSPAYETIEVARLPFETMGLREAYANVLRGFKAAHPGLIQREAPAATRLQDAEALRALLAWRSKTGVQVVEWLTLVRYESQVRSVTVRAASDRFRTQRSVYEHMVRTFRPHDPLPFK